MEVRKRIRDALSPASTSRVSATQLARAVSQDDLLTYHSGGVAPSRHAKQLGSYTGTFSMTVGRDAKHGDLLVIGKATSADAVLDSTRASKLPAFMIAVLLCCLD